MPCGIASSPERGSFWYGTFLMRENAAFRCGPSGESVSVAVRRPRQTRNKKRFSAEYGHSEAEAILNQNYELFTYPCLRRHKLLRLSGAAQRAQRGSHLSGCTGSGAGLTARYQGLQPHALGFRLNFHADTRIPPQKLPLALNQHLPPDIRVLAAQTVPEDFHARYAAHTKTYLYRIHNHPIDSPFDAAYYTRVPRRLDEAAMQAAAQQFVGTHDFLALCAAGSSAAAHGDTVRTITDCHVTRRGDEVDIEVTADGYLYNMVRILAGTLCEVGAGRLRAADIPAILASRDRSRAGPTLPAKGLFLKCVDYPEKEEQP